MSSFQSSAKRSREGPQAYPANLATGRTTKVHSVLTRQLTALVTTGTIPFADERSSTSHYLQMAKLTRGCQRNPRSTILAGIMSIATSLSVGVVPNPSTQGGPLHPCKSPSGRKHPVSPLCDLALCLVNVYAHRADVEPTDCRSKMSYEAV
jgi:hypothetical protein